MRKILVLEHEIGINKVILDFISFQYRFTMQQVKAKKHLGQHFLKDLKAAERIVSLLSLHGGYKKVLEIGPGMGVLTQFMMPNAAYETSVIEIDKESVEYLKNHYPDLENRIFSADFLQSDLPVMLQLEENEKVAIIGNFPYNISTQIFFHILDYKDTIPEVVCMLQKEVAERIASPEGNKDYGILSVLLQAYYDIEYVFTVLPGAFNPPPKVDSGIIRLRRNQREKLPCNEKLFKQIVKVGFGQRRKMLRNPLKSLNVTLEHPFMQKRAEQLSVEDFFLLTNLVEEERIAKQSN